jgi:hypothetical protein
MRLPAAAVLSLALTVILAAAARAEIDPARVHASLAGRFAEQSRPRLEVGVRQVAALWTAEDGSPEEMARFCAENFVDDPAEMEACFDRLERVYETLWGHLHVINRVLREPVDLDLGEPLPVDRLLVRFSPTAHVEEDFFANGIAFFVLLNFPHHDLAAKEALGPGWDRRQWAMARLGDVHTSRVPSAVTRAIDACTVAMEDYVYGYYVHADHLLSPAGEPMFPAGLRLIEHWGLRDEIRGRYTDPDGLPRQEALHEVMLRIIDGTIPAQVIGSSELYWDPRANRLRRDRPDGPEVPAASFRPDDRYARLLEIYRTYRELDPYHPDAPSVLARAFDVGRELSRERYEKLITTCLESPAARGLFDLIRARLGRDLRPFDIWYNGFKLAGSWDEAELDRRTRALYPTARAFQDDLPRILGLYGFSDETAAFLSRRIVVDDSKGSGHAMGAEMREDAAHLRTRVEPDGMDYKAYNIALHEMGHNIEQIFSLHAMDHYLLRGVPNNGFTEALAIMCQNRDLEILGVAEPDPRAADHQTLDTFLSVMEIGSVGLVEARIWQWMYDHPGATAQELRDAVLTIAKDFWNEYFTPLMGVEDSPLLAVYAHMLSNPAYLPNYSLGHVILFQLESWLRGRDWAAEVERMFRQGNLTPDLWMQEAVGAPISVTPLVEEARRALERLGE